MKVLPLLLTFLVACETPTAPPVPRPSVPTPIQHGPAVTYILSDGFDLRASVKLSADGRFEFSWVGCLGSIATASGQYVAEDNSVTFMPANQAFERDPRTFADVMRRVRWGEREYLVPEDNMLAFVNAINSGEEPRSTSIGLFYLRQGDEHKPASARPDIGLEWSAFLLDEPLFGNVIKVEQRETSTQRPLVIVDAGTRSGLRKGMQLHASNPRRPHLQAWLEITELGDDWARALVSFQYNEVRVCDVWSTREFDNRDKPQARLDDDNRVATCLRSLRHAER
jgi:hypothetical protein